MRCVVCKHGETGPGRATVTLTRAATTLVVKGVPADVCQNCGEEYVDELTSARLIQTMDEAERAGVEVDVREFVAA
jgi:YgiT-type zinc finger domain-containing protein